MDKYLTLVYGNERLPWWGECKNNSTHTNSIQDEVPTFYEFQYKLPTFTKTAEMLVNTLNW